MLAGAGVGPSVAGDGADRRCVDRVMHPYSHCQSPHLSVHPGNISPPVG